MTASRTVARLTTSSDIRFTVEAAPCDRCEDLCWVVEAWAHDLLGSGEKACVLYVPHQRSRGAAMELLAGMIYKWSGSLLTEERREWMLEHQGPLF